MAKPDNFTPGSAYMFFLESAARDVQPRRAVPSQKHLVRNTPVVHQLSLKLDVQTPAKKLFFKETCEIQHKIEKTLPADKKHLLSANFELPKMVAWS